MRKNERQELPTTGDKGQAEAAASGETKQTPEVICTQNSGHIDYR